MQSTLLSRMTLLLVLALGAGPALAQEASKSAEAEPSLLSVDLQSAAWVLGIFLVLAFILYKKAWVNVLAGLKGREQRIRGDIAQAEEARLKAEATLKEYNQQLATAEARARELIAKATVDAVKLADHIKADAENAAQERAERALRDIEDAREQALRDIYAQAADLSTSIAERILKRSLNANDQRDLVAQSIEQVSAVNRG
ncbi:MAG TPA: F0F1 ATP synthase subunit B [Tepidisphaeraceae bacterium]|nr:F0F1 ATP synthase subunit B [Tepidisphaeraceae bacterium]